MENDSARQSNVARLIALLDAVAKAGGRLRYRDAARTLAPVSPNTVARLLRELVAARVLERADGGYRLGVRPVFWATSVPPERDLRLAARPALVRLATSLGLTSCISACLDGHMTIIDRIVAPCTPALMPPGRFFPVNASNMGGAFFMDPADLADPARWLARLGNATAGTDPEVLRQHMLRGVSRGFLDDGGLVYVGLRRLAAPVRRDGRIIACLGLGGRLRQLADPDRRRRAGRMLRAAADRLSS